jgi:large subunit ribosomal protein L7/L12
MNSFFAILVAAYLLQPARVVADDCGSYTVMLNSFGMSDGYTMSLDLASKENVIKAVREVTVLGLREAKELVEAAPTSVAEGLSPDEAESIQATLEAAGAEVELVCEDEDLDADETDEEESAEEDCYATLTISGGEDLDVIDEIQSLLEEAGCESEIAYSEGDSDGDADCGSYAVLLNSYGASKVNVIKAVREVTVLGLREAKELVEAAPTSVAEGLSSEEAESMTATLEAAGAEVEIECDE